ncbi:MAG: hypothetical protein C7B45_15420 [Sulfobacillus acidophilus]|uniref:Uncharacterized protein n=1 Tax=Sulfobacillus acidophilus TaxID=53633 RepID=A0A2T2WDK7_9FIRM|nr:MAG: hypothetical protein C7B45_15420 [Sulfobacillus acidophilus]
MDAKVTEAGESASIRSWPISLYSLRRALHEELEYVDTLASIPFRVLDRQVHRSEAAWQPEAEDAIRAVEGIVRLPIKILVGLTEDSNSARRTTPPEK